MNNHRKNYLYIVTQNKLYLHSHIAGGPLDMFYFPLQYHIWHDACLKQNI